MRSVSSSGSGRTRLGRIRPLTLAALCASLVLGVAPSGSEVAPAATDRASYREQQPANPAIGNAAARSSASGTYTTSTGETVRVSVSDAYPSPSAVGQRWADFLAALLHGDELGLVDVYVVSPAELRAFCGPLALGCYGSNRLVFAGETVDGVTPEEVATHEYGHHVAANRRNPPWSAIDWGPKRWASAANICARAAQGAVFPNGYPANYRLHPGEGFAEVYRVLNETRKGGTTFGWPIVDLSFYPDAAALRAAEQDVVDSWTAPVTRALRTRFTATGKVVWSTRVAIPLDGTLTVFVRFPRGALHELTVLADDGRTVLTRGLWSGNTEKSATTTVCGQRSVVVRVTRRGPASPFTLRITHD